MTMLKKSGYLVVCLCFTLMITSCGGGGATSGSGSSGGNQGNPSPSITSLSPSSAVTGDAAQTLTINGTGFLSSSTVTYNGAAHTATFLSATQLTIQLSASDQGTVGTYPVVVTNPAPGGGSSAPLNFTVDNPTPVITSISPQSVPAASSAQTLTIDGTGFVTGSEVTLDGASVSASMVNAAELTVQLSTSQLAAPGAYPVVVTNPGPGGGASNSVSFAVTVSQQSATTDSNGIVNLPNGLSVKVVNVASQEALSGMNVTLLQDAVSQGLVITDPQYKYAPGFFVVGDPSSSSESAALDPAAQAGATLVAGLIPSALRNNTDSVQAINLPNDLLGQYSTETGTSGNCSTTTVGNVDPYLSQIIKSSLTSPQAQSDTAIAEKFPLDIDSADDTGAAGFAAWAIEQLGPAAEAAGVEVHYKLWGYTDSTALQACVTPFGILVTPQSSPSGSSPSPTAMTSGTIVDASTGLPITGATIGVAGVSIPAPLTTDSSGGFTVPSLIPGQYDVTALAPGYVPNGEIVSLQAGQLGQVIIQLAPYQSSAGPFITSVTPILGQDTQGIVIDGAGFGSTPPQTTSLSDGSVDTLACNTSTPSLAIRDGGSGVDMWSAGRDTCTNTDAIGLSIVSWSDTQIVLKGFGSALGNASNPSGYNISATDPLSVVVFGPNNSGGATYNLQVASATPTSAGSNPTTLQVPAAQEFTDTGISLNSGDEVTITAAGLVTLTTDGHIPPMSAAGFPPNCAAAAPIYGQTSVPFVDPQLPCWSLVGRIGTNGPIFEVGPQAFFVAQSGGELYLSVNDNFFGDNSGYWTVSIEVDPGGN